MKIFPAPHVGERTKVWKKDICRLVTKSALSMFANRVNICFCKRLVGACLIQQISNFVQEPMKNLSISFLLAIFAV